MQTRKFFNVNLYGSFPCRTINPCIESPLSSLLSLLLPSNRFITLVCSNMLLLFVFFQANFPVHRWPFSVCFSFIFNTGPFRCQTHEPLFPPTCPVPLGALLLGKRLAVEVEVVLPYPALRKKCLVTRAVCH